MNIQDIATILRSFPPVAALVSPVSAGSVVRVERGEDTFRPTVNGKPTFLHGGGSKELLAAMGGNTFRTWGADHARKDLDEGARYGLTVMVGFWPGHTGHGFDYTNREALRKTREGVLRTVRAENRETVPLLGQARRRRHHRGHGQGHGPGGRRPDRIMLPPLSAGISRPNRS